MKAASALSRSVRSVLGTLALLCGATTSPAVAQTPYLLPYTIQTYAGGGTVVAAGSACVNAPAFTSYDAYGDGCPVSSPSVVLGSGNDIHDVVVDQQGNIFFLDNGSNGLVRRIDARSGVITVYMGSFGVQTACAAQIDKYGDNCPANDGRANVAGGYTGGDSKGRGLAVARNGDLYVASYSGNLVHRISLASGLMTVVAGYVTGSGKASLYTGARGFTGDGGNALLAELNNERGVGVDVTGNIYIADTTNNVIRRVNAATGIITTIAGNSGGTAGFSGDGGPAASALLTGPEDVEIDPAGNIFIADQGNGRIRVIYQGGAVVANLIARTNSGVVATPGSIYSIIGNNIAGTTYPTPSTSNPGPVLATSIPIGSARKIALDAHDNVYFADNGNNVIWFLDASTGYMRVIAGTLGLTTGGASCTAHTDTFGDNCPGNTATFAALSATGVSVDPLGQLYFTDTGDLRLRRVLTNQVFPATAAGATLTQTLSVHFATLDGPAAASAYTFTGSPDFTFTGQTCTTNADTTQDCLVTVAFHPTGSGAEAASLSIASRLNGAAVFSITGTGTAAAVAFDPGATTTGNTLAGTAGTAYGIALDPAGNTLVADTANNRVLRYTGAATPAIIAAAAGLKAPRAAVSSPDGTLYIADTGNNIIRRVDPLTGAITTVAGGATTICASATDALGDGCPGTAATLNAPAGLVTDSAGNLFIADSGNNIIRELSVTGYLSAVAGGATTPCATTATNGVDSLGNNCPALMSLFKAPAQLAIDSARNLYIADPGNNEVRELVTASNTILRVAGNGQPGSSGNGGTANTALLSAPTGVAVDAAGNVYIADSGNSAIRVVSAGLINTIAGTLNTPGTGAVGASAYAIGLTNPTALASTTAGRLTILDSGNNRFFTDDRGSVSLNLGRANLGSSSPVQQIQQTATGNQTVTSPSPLFTVTGNPSQFTLTPTGSNGCSAPVALAPQGVCLLAAQFVPTVLGQNTATYTEAATNTVNTPLPSVALTGTGAVLTPTTTTVTVTGTPQFAVPFTVTAGVVPATCNTAAPSCIPTGTVQFFVDNNAFGAPIAVSSTGTAATQINGITVGTHNIFAIYSGDDFYSSSTSLNAPVVIAQGPTRTTLTASAASTQQFTPVSLTATVTGPTANIPTGTITFFAGSVNIGTDPITASTGQATDADPGNSFGLPAGTYAVTARYNGDTNYAASTSAPFSLTIAPDPALFTIATVNPSNSLPLTTVGTAQGSTGQLNLSINPTNTFNGSVTFTCTGMPQYADCTFAPTTLAFTPVAAASTAQQTQITLFTDIAPGVSGASLTRPGLFGTRPGLFGTRPALVANARATTLATLLGWPVLLTSLTAVFALRRRLRTVRLLAVLALFGLLAGGSAVLTGCGSGASTSGASHVTPAGVYTIQVVAKGPTTTVSTPITFTVTTGVPGQL